MQKLCAQHENVGDVGLAVFARSRRRVVAA
jgi:hypothetical protein